MAFHASLSRVREWTEQLSQHCGVIDGLHWTSSEFVMYLATITSIVEEDAEKRPLASDSCSSRDVKWSTSPIALARHEQTVSQGGRAGHKVRNTCKFQIAIA